MNKSKFKSVKFLPFDLQLEYYPQYDNTHTWESATKSWQFLRLPESTIEQYPGLFEVEKAEREFEDKAYYWARADENDEMEIVQYKKSTRRFYFINDTMTYGAVDFVEIGEKIEL